jgi:hypothetical protein
VPSNQVLSRSFWASAIIVLACSLGSCSSGSGGSGPIAGSSLQAALSHVADTPATRAAIAYDDTSALVQLAGTDPGATKGFAQIRGWGAASLADMMVSLSGDTGISVFGEDYSITAGNPPQALTLLHGGQDASLVTSSLTKLGWKQNGGMLVGPAYPAGGSGNATDYALQLHVVQASGSDLTFGGSAANLSQIGSPSGSTLAGDPLVAALASCLGDVVAAQVQVGGDLGGRNPVAVAVGVAAPASNAATPHAVACVAWPSQAGATQYAADARKALSSGSSLATNQPFSAVLANPSVTSIGGSQHIVQWQADTPGRADRIFQMYLDRDLPGLPYCARLPVAARSRIIGCG